jgi:hypothetical protein
MDIEAQLAAIRRLDAMLEGERIDYWIFGGWAVDFHAGRVTREHSDIDIAVWIADLAAVHTLLIADGWTHSPVAEDDVRGWWPARRDSNPRPTDPKSVALIH